MIINIIKLYRWILLNKVNILISILDKKLIKNSIQHVYRDRQEAIKKANEAKELSRSSSVISRHSFSEGYTWYDY